MIIDNMISFKKKRTLLEAFQLAMAWVENHSLQDGGITVSNLKLISYPEVSGYFIPTLLAWGERDRACTYARWLVSIQYRDGSWSDPEGRSPYTFDTGQILKGLIALIETLPELEHPIRRGCDWLLTQVLQSGRVVTPDTSLWNLPGNRTVPEAIHLYALPPLREAGEKFGKREYLDAVLRALDYYTSDSDLTSFNTLSHFHAYVVEALIDLGRSDLAEKGMKEISDIQNRGGFVPAYPDVKWVCSTGLFQYSLIWYKLGDVQRGGRAFSAAARLQNRSGGVFGSYGWGASYFPRAEISWAVKYFLDALMWKIRSGFDKDSTLFPDAIDGNDGRYRMVADSAKSIGATRILEAGCGKGRFLRRLQAEYPFALLTGLDLSGRMLESLPEGVASLCGSLLNIPCGDKMFDFVFCIEALEHAVNISGAVSELFRVLKPGGMLVIIDKNRKCRSRLKIAEWEQWFEEEQIANLLRKLGCEVRIERNIPYDSRDGSDGLFLGWIARKPEER
jgi:malonyl-CoA O-methyltransferase